MKIFIDAGHNFSGADTGAVANGIREQDITFLIADKLKSLLISFGHEVFMSRNNLEDNVGSTLSDSLNTRVNLANRYGTEFFISIHCNAFNGEASGTETLIFSFNSKAYEYAKRIQNAITQKLSTKDRGVKERKDLAVLKKTLMPAVLIETAFIDNLYDAELLKRQDDFAEAIFEGITGSKYMAEVSETDGLVAEFSKRGIITDKKLWLSKFAEDKNAYFLAKKVLDYMKRRGI
ncbi:MAG: N-acetylmuramoyl-L-alanine amidase [Ruminococcaceae bacterium]|nr:N-acetylmuramoyl-L-alanine amidase [Oscillospiraceae bacterium]